jgi:seryl-tRNA synthetase
MAADKMLIADQLRAVLLEPETINALTNAVSEKLKQHMEKLSTEVAELKDTVAKKDEHITELTARLDDLEQYNRRNGVRIFGYPEQSIENTDSIVIEIAGKIGVKLSPDDISRSHRVGPKSLKDRPLIVKFVSYRKRRELIQSRSKLKGASHS